MKVNSNAVWGCPVCTAIARIRVIVACDYRVLICIWIIQSGKWAFHGSHCECKIHFGWLNGGDRRIFVWITLVLPHSCYRHTFPSKAETNEKRTFCRVLSESPLRLQQPIFHSAIPFKLHSPFNCFQWICRFHCVLPIGSNGIAVKSFTVRFVRIDATHRQQIVNKFESISYNGPRVWVWPGDMGLNAPNMCEMNALVLCVEDDKPHLPAMINNKMYI